MVGYIMHFDMVQGCRCQGKGDHLAESKVLKQFEFHGILVTANLVTPYFVHFNMDVTEVTVGQLKKFNTVTNCIIFV